ncbi:MAG: CarD family transcriptional regulator, partial [bacterium]
MKEFSLKRGETREIARAIESRAGELEIGRKEKNAILESLKDGIPFAGMEFLLPYFYPSLSAPLAYLPAEALIWMDQAGHVEAEAERFEKLVWQRAAKAKEEGRFTPPVETLYLSAKEWQEGLDSFAQAHSEALDIAPPGAASQDSFLAVKCYLNTDIHHDIALLQGREPSLAPFVARLKEWQGERVFFVAPSQSDAKRLQELLAHYDIAVPLLDGRVPIFREETRYGISVGGLTQGFRLPEERLIVLTSDEIFGTRKRQQAPSKKSRPSHFITNLSELKQDNYVVHLDHGIGIYRGLKFLKVAGTEGEFLHLEYEGGDRLYLPVDRINLVQKYIGGEGAQPSLDRLGGGSWERVKAKTRKSVLAMAEELIEIYASREVHEGHAFSAPDQHYREFEAAFEFEETPDQERAIEETLRDMQKKKAMDRLICGDVGYGKTEVALRAAFLSVMEGKQAAVLVPTTILAQQHYQTFCHRFRGYPVRVEMLSRFLLAKESQRVLQDLAKGVVDIVIGTHRLL